MDSSCQQHHAILGLTKLFAEGLGFEKLLQKILEVDSKTISVGRVSVWMHDSNRGKLYLHDLFDADSKTHARGGELNREDYPIYFNAVDTSRILIMDDVCTHEATVELLDNYLIPLKVTSMLDVPIIIEGSLHGVLCHEHVGDPRMWMPEEVGFAASVADLVGQAILVDQLRRARVDLRASQERAEQIINSNPTALLLVDECGDIRLANQKAAEIFQTSREALEQMNVEDLIPPSIRGHHAQFRMAYLKKPQQRPMGETRELLARAPNGRVFPSEIGLCPLVFDDHTYILCGINDITNRKNAENRIKVLSTAFEQTPISMIVTDNLGAIQYVNPQFASETGKATDDVFGHNLIAISDGLSDDSTLDVVWRTLKQGRPWAGELATKGRNGQVQWEEIHIAPVNNDSGQCMNYVAIKLNISQRKEKEDMLSQYAMHDQLTGLPNRLYLTKQLQLAMVSAKGNNHSIALMFIDLDHFKNINDSLGHEVGDIVLRQSSIRMRDQLRTGDIVARIGGDEFIVVLANCRSSHDAVSIAQRIRAALNIPIDDLEISVKVTCSIGIALFPEHASNEIELFRHADQALYRVKETGRNSVAVY